MKRTASGARIFQTPNWLKAALVATVPLCAVVAVILYQNQGWSLLSVPMVLVALGAVAAVVDAWLARVILHNEELELFSHFRRRRIAKSEIESVSWAKGTPVLLHLANGEKLGLGELITGPGGASMLRAWLKYRSAE